MSFTRCMALYILSFIYTRAPRDHGQLFHTYQLVILVHTGKLIKTHKCTNSLFNDRSLRLSEDSVMLSTVITHRAMLFGCYGH